MRENARPFFLIDRRRTKYKHALQDGQKSKKKSDHLKEPHILKFLVLQPMFQSLCSYIGYLLHKYSLFVACACFQCSNISKNILYEVYE
jgi:hypothetical protein